MSRQRWEQLYSSRRDQARILKRNNGRKRGEKSGREPEGRAGKEGDVELVERSGEDGPACS